MDINDDPLAKLIAQAGPRTQAPAEMEADVRAAVYEAWQQGLRREHRRRWIGWLSAAALAAIAVGVGLRMTLFAPSPVPALIASLAHAEGEVRVNRQIENDQLLQTPLYSGDEVLTGADGGARLDLSNAASIRLASQTRVHWLAANELELLDGAIYVDSGPQHAALSIKTNHGVVSHLGTRYQVRIDAQTLSVGVRDGAVEVSTPQGKAGAQTRQQLKIDAQGRITRSPLAPYGDDWAWVDALAPRFAIDNRSVAEFLEWAAGETGHQLEYRGAEIQAAAAQTRLSGDSKSFTPAQALAAVLPTTDFTVRYESDRMIVERH